MRTYSPYKPYPRVYPDGRAGDTDCPECGSSNTKGLPQPDIANGLDSFECLDCDCCWQAPDGDYWPKEITT